MGFRRIHYFLLAAYASVAVGSVAQTAATSAAVEQWRTVPMPEGFQVQATALEGPVFADGQGRTLYMWPQHKARNGYSGEAPGKPACYDQVLTVTAGLMSPYPPGIRLPELDTRPSCTDLWPPVLAEAGAEPIGDWSIVTRRDGARQWAYREQPLYTSVRDSQPGDTFGGTTRRRTGGNGDSDRPAIRVPVAPPPQLPPGFAVKTTVNGRMLTTDTHYAVYAFEEDSATSLACRDDCLSKWEPLLAPELARSRGEWSTVTRSPGVRQWVFRNQPLYSYKAEPRTKKQNWKQTGSDEPGWYNVYTQQVPRPPPEFTVQATLSGNVLADESGRTIYVYRCADDSQDQLACDHPSDTQVYRLAICGGGDAQRCRERWPYVSADPDAQGSGRAWRPRWIDPTTGRYADAESEGALRVWTYRDRPVYTYYLDEKPGDVHGAGTGEWRGKRNGLLAFWLRNDLMGGVAE